MIVVADTTPLRYLILIRREIVLPALYGRVLIPLAVFQELNHQSAPEAVRQWLRTHPDWLDVRQPSGAIHTRVALDAGELEAIALAEDVQADLVLIDDWDARQEAIGRNLRVVGTLRVLADGAKRGLLNLRKAFDLLQETNFRANPKLLQLLLDEFEHSVDRGIEESQ